MDPALADRTSPPDPLAPLLAGGRTIVLDGGLATELEAGGADLSDALWSARLLVEDPGAIVRAHLAFYRAGAQVATTASYQASFEGFARRGIGRDEARALMQASVDLADEARSIALAERGATPGSGRGTDGERPLLVAASVGPYGATLADGSEYRGRYGRSVVALRDWHRERFAALVDAGPDLLACETIPELEEGEALAGLIDERGAQAWLTFSCADGSTIRSGAPVEEAFAIADETAGVIALGINCTAPEHVLELIERAAAITAKPIVVYPNSGEAWDAATRHWIAPRPGPAAAGVPPVAPTEGKDAIGPGPVRAWVAAGARLVGGCCRVTPAQIGRIAGELAGAAA